MAREGEVVFDEETGFQLKVGRKKHDDFFYVDWKANPDEVIQGVNEALKALKINVKFESVECGDDNYYFIAKKRGS